MSKSVDINSLEKEHKLVFQKCEYFCKDVSNQIQHLLEKENIQLAVPIQYRVKTFMSISNKITQGRYSIKKSVLELQDLSGIRIITLFTIDALKVVELIKQQFEIIKEYNTADKLEDTQFGYSSFHIVGKLRENWLDVPSFSQYKDLKFEIQIRTLSQHSWAEVSNIFQYKSEDNVPKQLKRSISRISALLETVDLEFERLLKDRTAYKEDIQHQDTTDLILNVDLLEEVLNKKLPIEHKIVNEDYSVLLDNLTVLGYESVNKLSDLIDSYLEETIIENKRIIDGFMSLFQKDKDTNSFETYALRGHEEDRIKNGVFFTQCGLIRQMLNLDLKTNWNDLYKEKKTSMKTIKY
ncbi:GTP pyrophosphokinase [Flectobacillus longus]|uniref:GTP pyrophosphokinase n=1 Tax=Flectobacillus longus TaxID=2984207 RepID=UPI0024B8586A|nr:hypothetical protein [Flectobacillus longus]MDI9882419.1 hypothetical protein [Flectobacillus longus]